MPPPAMAELGRLLASHRSGRIVATGNGASFYVATALWLASLSTQLAAPVVAIPAGLLATDTFTLRPDDLILAFSTSGELRDLVELANGPQTCRCIRSGDFERPRRRWRPRRTSSPLWRCATSAPSPTRRPTSVPRQ